jgi:hypothetical protein
MTDESLDRAADIGVPEPEPDADADAEPPGGETDGE